MHESTPGEIERIGPVLHFRGHDSGPEGESLRLAAMVLIRGSIAPPVTTPEGDVWPEQIAAMAGWRVLRYSFALSSRAAWYLFEGERFDVAADFAGDLRLGFVSCNGKEEGDLDRSPEERNLMWQRLCGQHRERPFQLLLHGGDQLYADEVTKAHPLTVDWPKTIPDGISDEAAAELATALRTAFFERYVEQLAQPSYAWIAKRVPSLAMWDDHDICDGWGSLRHWKLDSRIGRILFAAAREAFLLFQFCARPDDSPGICPDPTGASFTWSVALPGLTLLAPDLRSERRRERVMGEAGWQAFRGALHGAGEGRIIVVSSVPALGPRLSLLESLMRLTPWMEKYEDDLRDQWQSHSHRTEWQVFLRELLAAHDTPGRSVTLVSGEIHLATRATMEAGSGPIHQLVASGISHPAPPRAYAACLGALARFGEAPLPGHPIRIRPLPGQRRIYTAERNYLVLERNAGDWTTVWELEQSGATEPLAL